MFQGRWRGEVRRQGREGGGGGGEEEDYGFVVDTVVLHSVFGVVCR